MKEKKGGKVFAALIIAIVLIVAIALAAVFISGHRSGNSDQTSSGDSIKIGESKSYSAGSNGQLSSVEIAAKVKPSVIAVVVDADGGQTYGEGSGVVMSVDEDKGRSYIVTCAHMINSPGTSVKVQLEDGTSYDATVVGYDNRTDIGVISVKTTKLTPAEFGDSSVLKVGEPVYAIGNPGGTQFYGSVTAGIISAIDRPTSSSESGYTMECIQHDAAINPGNSGGALVNSYGQVIGINSSKIASEDYEGMGFAVPISVAKKSTDSIMKHGYVTGRAKLGIQYMPCSENEQYAQVAKVNKLPNGAVVIAKINSDSAFAGTNVQAGDIITAVNGKDLKTSSSLLEAVEKGKPGDKMKLTVGRVDRNYKVTTFEVTVTLKEDRGNSSQSGSQSQNGGFTNPFRSGR